MCLRLCRVWQTKFQNSLLNATRLVAAISIDFWNSVYLYACVCSTEAGCYFVFVEQIFIIVDIVCYTDRNGSATFWFLCVFQKYKSTIAIKFIHIHWARIVKCFVETLPKKFHGPLISRNSMSLAVRRLPWTPPLSIP